MKMATASCALIRIYTYMYTATHPSFGGGTHFIYQGQWGYAARFGNFSLSGVVVSF